MVKIRKPGSIENGITEVLKILNEQEIEEAIGKGSSYLRKCSDPDLPQQIDHSDSLKLDLACLKKNKAPPLLGSHEYSVALNADNFEFKENYEDLDDLLVKFSILHGKLVEVVKRAQSPESDKGEKISDLEKKNIFESIKLVEDKIMKLKFSVDKES